MENKVDKSDLKTLILELQEYYNELENSICYEEEQEAILRVLDYYMAVTNYFIYIKENNIDSAQALNDDKIITDYYENLNGFDKDILSEMINSDKELKDDEKSEDPTFINLLEKDVNELTIILITLKELYLSLGLVYPLSRFREIKNTQKPSPIITYIEPEIECMEELVDNNFYGAKDSHVVSEAFSKMTSDLLDLKLIVAWIFKEYSKRKFVKNINSWPLYQMPSLPDDYLEKESEQLKIMFETILNDEWCRMQFELSNLDFVSFFDFNNLTENAPEIVKIKSLWILALLSSLTVCDEDTCWFEKREKEIVQQLLTPKIDKYIKDLVGNEILSGIIMSDSEEPYFLLNYAWDQLRKHYGFDNNENDDPAVESTESEVSVEKGDDAKSPTLISVPDDFFTSSKYVCVSQNNHRTLKEEAQDPIQIARLIFYIQNNNKDGIDSSITTAHTLLLFLSGRCIDANTPTGKISIHSKKAKLAIETAFNLLCEKANVIHLYELFTLEFTNKNNKEPKWRNPDPSRHNDTKNKIKALFPRIKAN